MQKRGRQGDVHGDQMAGLEAPGKEAEMRKWPFLINNGRTNIVWQSAYLTRSISAGL
jgi:hypothetical protein